MHEHRPDSSGPEGEAGRVPRSAGGSPNGEGIPAGSVVASVVLHVVAALLVVAYPGGEGPAIAPRQTYRVKLAAPAADEAPRRREPQPARRAEKEKDPPPPSPSDAPEPEVEEPATVREDRPRLPSPEPARAPDEGTDPANVQIEGKAFPFPGYLENIVAQIRRHWRPPTGKGHLRAELRFVIRRDGSVEEIEWIRRSGDLSFDLEARGAIETAGRKRAFGPLPEAFPRDRLHVSFYFDPTSQ